MHTRIQLCVHDFVLCFGTYIHAAYINNRAVVCLVSCIHLSSQAGGGRRDSSRAGDVRDADRGAPLLLYVTRISEYTSMAVDSVRQSLDPRRWQWLHRRPRRSEFSTLMYFGSSIKKARQGDLPHLCICSCLRAYAAAGILIPLHLLDPGIKFCVWVDSFLRLLQ